MARFALTVRHVVVSSSCAHLRYFSLRWCRVQVKHTPLGSCGAKQSRAKREELS